MRISEAEHVTFKIFYFILTYCVIIESSLEDVAERKKRMFCAVHILNKKIKKEVLRITELWRIFYSLDRTFFIVLQKLYSELLLIDWFVNTFVRKEVLINLDYMHICRCTGNALIIYHNKLHSVSIRSNNAKQFI